MTRRGTDRRRGFTMIELLIVVALILFLMTITVAAISGGISMAREAATRATLLKLHGLVQQRVDAFNRAMDRTNLSQNSPPVRKMSNDWLSTYNMVPPAKVLEVLVKKQFFQARFPQHFGESPGADLSTIVQTGVTYNASAHRQETESAALLYWILTNSDVYGVGPVDESEFSSSEVKDTDGDGLLEFVDGWGRPLRFYRWPTHLIRPGDGSTVGAGVITSSSTSSGVDLAPVNRNLAGLIWSGLPAAPAVPGEVDPLTRDPDDPTGQVYRWATTLGGGLSPAAALTTIQNFFGTPSTYHAFLIVSAGADGSLGMQEPFHPHTPSTPISLTFPTLNTPQGRLGGLLNWNLIDSPILDNLSNRKR